MESTNNDLSGKTDMVNPDKIQTLQATEIARYSNSQGYDFLKSIIYFPRKFVVLLFIKIIRNRDVISFDYSIQFFPRKIPFLFG